MSENQRNVTYVHQLLNAFTPVHLASGPAVDLAKAAWAILDGCGTWMASMGGTLLPLLNQSKDPRIDIKQLD